MKISAREKTLLVIALLAILTGLFYYFVYNSSAKDLQALKVKKKEVQSRYDSLRKGLGEDEKVDQEISEYEALIRGYLENFYTKTLQNEFIIKIEDMWAESQIKFGSTKYPNINAEYSDSRGGLGIKSYVDAINDTEQALKDKGSGSEDNSNKEEQTDQKNKNSSAEEKAAKEKDDARFKEFEASLNVTSTTFAFKGTYAQIWEFIRLMNQMEDINDKYVIANTFDLKEVSDDIDSVGFSKNSEKIYEASVTIYYYMTNDVANYLE